MPSQWLQRGASPRTLVGLTDYSPVGVRGSLYESGLLYIFVNLGAKLGFNSAFWGQDDYKSVILGSEIGLQYESVIFPQDWFDRPFSS